MNDGQAKENGKVHNESEINACVFARSTDKQRGREMSTERKVKYVEQVRRENVWGWRGG